MRLGPALLVALLPLLARANLTTSVSVSTDDPILDTWTPADTLSTFAIPSTSIIATVLPVNRTATTTPIALDQQQEPTAEAVDNGFSYANQASGFKKAITVGYLTAAKGELKERQGLLVSGAITYALEQINNSTEILPNITLQMKWNDTRGDTVLATRIMTEMICDGVSVFFGPESSCHVEAIVAQSRNIPMISYKCSDYKASSVPTFARTEPPDTQVTKSLLSLLRYYSWNKFSIIYEEAWQTVAKSLESVAKKHNMTINDIKVATDKHSCCEKNLLCCQSGYWYDFIQTTKKRTRIYVFLGTALSLIDLMTTMQTAQLFDNGEYIVIYVDLNSYSEKEAQKYLWRPDSFKTSGSCADEKDFFYRARSLLVVVPTAPTDSYETFTQAVRKYNSMAPFGFGTPTIFASHNYQKFVSIYAAYLYDSVKLYANALHTLLSRETNLDNEKIDEITANGTLIIDTIKNMSSYISITGANMKIDENGDSEGNFSVLALSEVDEESMMVSKNFSCKFQMRPVARFFENNMELPHYTAQARIGWIKKNPPSQEPFCGFDNELCKKGDMHSTSIILAGILGIVLFCVIVITISIYRKWKIEQEIEGLLWKIDRNDIFRDEDRFVVSPSRISIGSASANSYESRAGPQVFASIAEFRDVTVRIKELTFSRKKDISRDVMKEMRLLRELRHDNVNSFIGACVEPMSLLLVTDYCAKGSLYDIIENEDIKLDRMFIASLVHDLIKGMIYIHRSQLVCHGNLKSSNCVVTSRWVLQVTDFGLAEMRHCAENDSIGEHQYYRSLFWKAPELLRQPTAYIRGTQKGDVYAFAIILYEIITRRSPPYGNAGLEPKEIIDKVREVPHESEHPFRPDLYLLQDSEYGSDDYIMTCITDSWVEDPELRPDFITIRSRLKRMRKNRNIMDQMMEMMVKYANHLEDLVLERTRLLNEEKMKTVDLLHRMLPKPVAEKLTMGLGIEPEWFDQVTIYFSDIVGFTAMSAESTPLQVVNFLNDLYTVFDRIIKGYDVYKVETIGDAYMVVSGLPVRNGERHAGEIASMALDLLVAVKDHTISHRPKETVKLRIGIHTGPVVAGVVGLTMPRYCLFGDTVNTASRMESNGEPLQIHISGQCRDALENLGGYIMEERGLVNMKGKGEVRTYWLIGATEKAVQRREVDLGELPPLFCRPRIGRWSPKLNTDSRQASFCGGLMGYGGMNSRRQSSIPRGTSVDVESCSTLHNQSPLVGRSSFMKLPPRHALQLPDVGSKLTIGSTFGSQTIDTAEMETRPSLRSRRILSSIASSSDEPCKSHVALNTIRVSKSLDLLPLEEKKPLQLPKLFLSVPKRGAKSLENCEKCGEIQIFAVPENKLFNNNFPNGTVLLNEDNISLEDVEQPLLNSNNAIARMVQRKRIRRGIEEATDELASKRWRSLESVRKTGDEVARDTMPSMKNISRTAIKSWIVGLFNGTGIKPSNSVLNDYNSQLEKESVV